AVSMPLDPDDPPHRIKQILNTTGCDRVLASAPVDWCPDALLLDDPALPASTNTKDELALPSPAPLDLAYAISTSGSTGRPKTVAVPHEALLNLVVTSIDDLALVPGEDTVLWLSRPTVDVTVQDCLMALCSGATLA